MFQNHGSDRFPQAQLSAERRTEMRGILSEIALRVQQQASALGLALRPPTSVNPLTLQESALGRALLLLADVAEHGLSPERTITRESLGRALDLVHALVVIHPATGEALPSGVLGECLLGGLIGEAHLVLRSGEEFVPVGRAADELRMAQFTSVQLSQLARSGVTNFYTQSQGWGLWREDLETLKGELTALAREQETMDQSQRQDTAALPTRDALAGSVPLESSMEPPPPQKRPRGRPMGTTKKKD